MSNHGTEDHYYRIKAGLFMILHSFTSIFRANNPNKVDQGTVLMFRMKAQHLSLQFAITWHLKLGTFHKHDTRLKFHMKLLSNCCRRKIDFAVCHDTHKLSCTQLFSVWENLLKFCEQLMCQRSSNQMMKLEPRIF